MADRRTDMFQRHSGGVTCWFPHKQQLCLPVRVRSSARPHQQPARPALEEPIYNLERLLCIPREDRLVWAAPDFNLASQLQFPNPSSRLSVTAAAFTFAARQQASVRPLPFPAGQHRVYVPS